MFGLIDQPQHPLEEYSPENSHELRRLSSSLESSLVAMECSIPSTMQNVTGLPDPRLLLHWMVMDDGKAADLRKREIQERASLVQKVLLKDMLSPILKRHSGYFLPFDVTSMVFNGNGRCFRLRGGGCGAGNGKDEGNNGINVNLIIRKPPGWGRGRGQGPAQAPQPPQPPMGRPSMANPGQQYSPIVVAIPVPMCPGSGGQDSRAMSGYAALSAQQYSQDEEDEEQVVVIQDKYDPEKRRQFVVKPIPNDPEGKLEVKEIDYESEDECGVRIEELEDELPALEYKPKGGQGCDSTEEGDEVPEVVVYGDNGKILRLRGNRMAQPIVIVNGGTVDTTGTCPQEDEALSNTAPSESGGSCSTDSSQYYSQCSNQR